MRAPVIGRRLRGLGHAPLLADRQRLDFSVWEVFSVFHHDRHFTLRAPPHSAGRVGRDVWTQVRQYRQANFCRWPVGPQILSLPYEELLRTIAREAGLKPNLIPIPFVARHALAWMAEMLPNPLVTRNQVELMQRDNVSSPEMPGFGDLGISPHAIDEILREMMWDH